MEARKESNIENYTIYKTHHPKWKDIYFASPTPLEFDSDGKLIQLTRDKNGATRLYNHLTRKAGEKFEFSIEKYIVYISYPHKKFIKTDPAELEEELNELCGVGKKICSFTINSSQKIDYEDVKRLTERDSNITFVAERQPYFASEEKLYFATVNDFYGEVSGKDVIFFLPQESDKEKRDTVLKNSMLAYFINKYPKMINHCHVAHAGENSVGIIIKTSDSISRKQFLKSTGFKLPPKDLDLDPYVDEIDAEEKKKIETFMEKRASTQHKIKFYKLSKENLHEKKMELDIKDEESANKRKTSNDLDDEEPDKKLRSHYATGSPALFSEKFHFDDSVFDRMSNGPVIEKTNGELGDEPLFELLR